MIRHFAVLFVAFAVALAACTPSDPTPTAVQVASPTPSEPPVRTEAPPDTPSPEPPTAGQTPEATLGPLDGILREPVTDADRANAAAIGAADLPIGDLRDLAIRFKGLPADTPEKTCTTAPDRKSTHLNSSHAYISY